MTVKGIYYHKPTQKWRVYRHENGSRYWVGQYQTYTEAVEAALPYQKKKQMPTLPENKKVPFSHFYKRLEDGEEIKVGSIILVDSGNLYIVTKVKVKDGVAVGEMKFTPRRFNWSELSKEVICI
ncbi:AP2 domain-containing protein [Thermoactinomyces sp. DSM 45892]|uniref:AP2 domain-containing protein n=1 Tax=Thermoactinomyces sp. DSM 45892 TaxID=1882753 RepID=UPI00089AC722|nr:AP2 domain-containing protein [Thermoactinomyces sp. DSM 45892]SDY69076.1 AP2 domain-containing protein [Thermoactinomyces sp. DSM 45892]